MNGMNDGTLKLRVDILCDPQWYSSSSVGYLDNHRPLAQIPLYAHVLALPYSTDAKGDISCGECSRRKMPLRRTWMVGNRYYDSSSRYLSVLV